MSNIFLNSILLAQSSLSECLSQIGEYCSSYSNDPGGYEACSSSRATDCYNSFSGSSGSDRITNPALTENIRNLTGIEYLRNIIPKLIGVAFVLGVTFFFLYFLLGAIQWIISGGDKGKIEESKTRITTALVGLFVLLGLYAIVGLVEAVFSINIVKIDLGPLVL